MTMLGQMLWDMGVEKGMEKGIQAMILDNLDEGIPDKRIIEKLSRRFSLKEADAAAFFKKYAPDREK